MPLRKVLYYTAQQLKSCLRAREALALRSRCPRGSEGWKRAGQKGCLCVCVSGIGAAARQKAPKCEVRCWPYGDGRKARWPSGGPPTRSAGNMAFRTYRGAALFCAFLRTSAQNMTRGALTVRRCDCAETHIIPIAYQLHTKMLNMLTSYAARSPAATLRSHRAMLDCSHVKQSQVRHSLTLFLSGTALTHGSQGRSQGESAQVRANKTRGKPQSGPQSGLKSVARPPTGVARRGAG